MLANITLGRPLVVFDLEATGTDTQKDRIAEIATLKIHPGGESRMSKARLNPGIPTPPEATAVHGITDADVAGKPSFASVAPRLAKALDGCDLCGFNILRYDIELLVAEFQRPGVPFPLQGRRFVDPCAIFFAREPRDLTAAMKFYCDRDLEGAHGAEADVLAAVAVLAAEGERYADLPRSVGEQHDLFRAPAAVGFEGKFLRRPDGVVVCNSTSATITRAGQAPTHAYTN